MRMFEEIDRFFPSLSVRMNFQIIFPLILAYGYSTKNELNTSIIKKWFLTLCTGISRVKFSQVIMYLKYNLCIGCYDYILRGH